MEKFSVYPAGAQGVALLSLRASLACTLLSPTRNELTSLLPDLVLLIVGGALLLGGLVRPLAACAVVLTTVELLSFDSASFAHWLDAAAITILGPGAYSVDARIFGRRVIRVAASRSPPPPYSDG